MVSEADKPVGVLTLQGDYGKHRQAFASLGRATLAVRRPAELDQVSSLVIPGGESTTLTRLMDRAGLRAPLCAFADTHPMMGTCAGLIMMARGLASESESGHGVVPLGLLDCTVRRNAYGRQIDSFTAPLGLDLLAGGQVPYSGVFIRAPRIVSVGDDVDVLIFYRDEPVAVRQGHLLGLTFHPELTADLRIHRAFLAMVDSR